MKTRTRRPATGPKRRARTLAEQGVVEKARVKPVPPSKPRFFERAQPNHQLWQSDIMTFRLAGRNAYLTGFINVPLRYGSLNK